MENEMQEMNSRRKHSQHKHFLRPCEVFGMRREPQKLSHSVKHHAAQRCDHSKTQIKQWENGKTKAIAQENPCMISEKRRPEERSGDENRIES